MKDLQRLQNIFSKTDGNCHLCHKKLSFNNHGKRGLKGAWHVEHSIARANGGTNHLNNLFAACIGCNCDKGIQHTKTARKRNGVSRAPYSKEKKETINDDNILTGIISGGILGSKFGPMGIFWGALAGGLFGNSTTPNK